MITDILAYAPRGQKGRIDHPIIPCRANHPPANRLPVRALHLTTTRQHGDGTESPKTIRMRLIELQISTVDYSTLIGSSFVPSPQTPE
ncbi:hypothetical protein [Actinokineospora enzanensis]|uniref:hypothetical protein n=1 Tax=Actinokineospora enzanensis TaxID=155975 RepID=UPI0012EB8F95|nr:hypothetical protein [Actinokineospora enzanensis]